MAVMFLIFEFIVLVLTDIFWPEENIDIARSFDTPEYTDDMHMYGDHEFYVNNKDTRSTRKPREIVTIDCHYSVEQDRIASMKKGRRFETLPPTHRMTSPKKVDAPCKCQIKPIQQQDAKKNNSTQTNKVEVADLVPKKAVNKQILVDLDDLRYSTPELKTYCRLKETGEISPTMSSLDTADSLLMETPYHKVAEPSSKLESAPMMKILLSHDS